MSIYTKGGDKGETSLYVRKSGKFIRVSKSSLRIDAIGCIDEANSILGVVLAFSKSKELENRIERIQRDLFTIGSILAGSKLKLSEESTSCFEKEIDEMDVKLPVLANFILPGGDKLGSLLHLARTIMRRAERSVVALSKKERVGSEILKYINRLSDYVFMLARFENYKTKRKEKIWDSKQ